MERSKTIGCKDIQSEITREIAVLSTSGSGYTKELNLVSWNGAEPKYDMELVARSGEMR